MATHCKHCGYEIWQKVPSATVEWEHCETGSQLCYDYPGSVKAEPDEERERIWVIHHPKRDLYWSMFGWVEDEPIALFTNQNKETFELPEGGVWEIFDE